MGSSLEYMFAKARSDSLEEKPIIARETVSALVFIGKDTTGRPSTLHFGSRSSRTDRRAGRAQARVAKKYDPRTSSRRYPQARVAALMIEYRPQHGLKRPRD